ncbi:DAGAT-domain-containing protein [Gonapodya prolifera JEL478]|uniref:DAGAT-domain-containing protein n=1 Tax=Gonapodya prolifera (strain JEL478) TaxID=1344416 RepID=A0A139ATF9_GONPJ|nr:DAGAT-domain-containing protein [Gonapodya prolifera JEL478]|eukprot:KXS19853.1 DAGAT-domain-containing protein [Gonapodya prolifera JEL478]
MATQFAPIPDDLHFDHGPPLTKMESDGPPEAETVMDFVVPDHSPIPPPSRSQSPPPSRGSANHSGNRRRQPIPALPRSSLGAIVPAVLSALLSALSSLVVLPLRPIVRLTAPLVHHIYNSYLKGLLVMFSSQILFLLPLSIKLYQVLWKHRWTSPLAAAYTAWIVLFDRSPWRGGRPISWVRNNWVYDTLVEAFPMRIVRDGPELDSRGRYLFACHPHGILGTSFWVCFTSDRASRFSSLFPGIQLRVATLSSNFFIPVGREYLLGRGFIGADKKSLKWWLCGDEHGLAREGANVKRRGLLSWLKGSRKSNELGHEAVSQRVAFKNVDRTSSFEPIPTNDSTGVQDQSPESNVQTKTNEERPHQQSIAPDPIVLSRAAEVTPVPSYNDQNSHPEGHAVAIVVGGAQEALYAIPGTNRLVLNRRKGFIRVALETGARLVPVYAFGENDLFSQVANPTLRYLQGVAKQYLGWTPVVFWGRWGLPVPRMGGVVVVVGKPLSNPHIQSPTVDDVDYWHAEYISALRALYERYKDIYDLGRTEGLTIVE